MLVRTIHLAVPTLLLLSGAVSAMAQRAQVVTQTPIPAQSTVVIAPSAPPPPRVETMPAPPTEQRVVYWQPGHWIWDGSSWSWQEGQYVDPPTPQAVWEPGGWVQQPAGGYVWVDGHWVGRTWSTEAAGGPA
jgi:hypothetical protein